MLILGISCYYHDSAAAIIRDGILVSAVQEERFTRIKHDNSFPAHSVLHCLKEAAVSLDDVHHVAYYENPAKKLSRIIAVAAAHGLASPRELSEVFFNALSGKYLIRRRLLAALKQLSSSRKPKYKLHAVDHHVSHAASAFYPSPFSEAAILIADGVGEWATTSLGYGDENGISLDSANNYPHSVGLLYSAFTAFLGFKVNSGEYKVMGLAPYGAPIYKSLILNKLISLSQDGRIALNMEFFSFHGASAMYTEKLAELLGIPPRKPESELNITHLHLASSIQEATNELMLMLATTLRARYRTNNLCMAGGVALNCVANSIILTKSGFQNVWVQPAAGDAGGALGSAAHLYHTLEEQSPEMKLGLSDSNYCLGPSFTDTQIEAELRSLQSNFERVDDGELLRITCDALEQGEAVGWFQGRMEFGPRALGARSILADPRSPSAQNTLNMKIKFRESFRPFAPAVLEEQASDWFEWDRPSPYMTFVASLKGDKKTGAPHVCPITGRELRSSVPAVTHVDYSSRLQTVSKARNARFYSLLDYFHQRTGCPVLLNTSFNIRGEPIVCTPRDAYRCFMATNLDLLVMGNYILRKSMQSTLAIAHYRDALPLD